ncbi:MAG: hypothetical protein KGI98_10700 [Euryarchaeota archaeon]|nr:hypothetical protein [Euryarchaeota archaeon]
MWRKLPPYLPGLGAALLAASLLLPANALAFGPGPTPSTSPRPTLSAAVSTPGTPLPDPQVYAALGDSITPAYDSDSNPAHLGEQPWYSYAVGNNTNLRGNVFSFYQRLLTIYPNTTGQRLTEHLLAVPGDKAMDMVWQSVDAVEERAGFVTILIGGNDVCHSSSGTPAPTSVANFSQSLNHTFRVLGAGLAPNAVIAMANVVNVTILWDLFGGNSQAQLVWQNTCPALLTSSGRAMMEYMIRAYNHMEALIVANATAHFSQTISTWDIGNLSFSALDVNTLDFFHPSPFGHAEIADEWWAALPYAAQFPRFTSAPALPASIPVATHLVVQVGVQDVMDLPSLPPYVNVTYKETGAFFWSTVNLSAPSGSWTGNGTLSGTLPFNATSTVGTLDLYVTASDESGYHASLPASAPSTMYQVEITSPSSGPSYPLANVSLRALSSSTLPEGGTVTFDALAFDSNHSLMSGGVAYSWTLSLGSLGQLIPENDGSSALFVAAGAPGNATVRVEASSGLATASTSAGLQVLPPAPPTSQPAPSPGPTPVASYAPGSNLGLLLVVGPAAFLGAMATGGMLLRRRYLNATPAAGSATGFASHGPSEEGTSPRAGLPPLG